MVSIWVSTSSSLSITVGSSDGYPKPKSQGKNLIFLLPEPNPRIETQKIPKNPRFFQVSEFPSKFPIFYSRNSKKALIFPSKITLELFSFWNYLFFQKYFNLYEVWKILKHKNAIKIAEGVKNSLFQNPKNPTRI